MDWISFQSERVQEKRIVLVLPEEARHPTQSRTKLVITTLLLTGLAARL